MKPSLRWVVAPALALFSSLAFAEFHTYQIEQIFSNASGTVQFIVMHESQGASAEYFWKGNQITTTSAQTGAVNAFSFPNNLPVSMMMCGYYTCDGGSTANTRVLIATQGFRDLGILVPDFVVPNGFIPTGGGMITINYAGVDQVSFNTLPTDGVTSVNRLDLPMSNLATNFAGNTAVIAPIAVELNQHGLTGSYYQQTTKGQGVEVEIYPDQMAVGTGLAFLSWFTYDSIAGGADHQRWYTIQGPVQTGQPSATLNIYQNTGGNFNDVPVTNGQQVGTANLSFDSCTSGQLSYNFTDGTGRNGNIALTRLTQNVTCSTTSARPTNADFALSGNWLKATTSGQGVTVEVNPNNPTLFAAWYTYAPNGVGSGAAGQRWYTAQPKTSFTPGSRSIDVVIYENTGGTFNAATQTIQTAVGTGTLAFQSCSAATLTYNFTGGTSNGLNGVINLSRVGPVPPGCTS